MSSVRYKNSQLQPAVAWPKPSHSSTLTDLTAWVNTSDPRELRSVRRCWIETLRYTKLLDKPPEHEAWMHHIKTLTSKGLAYDEALNNRYKYAVLLPDAVPIQGKIELLKSVFENPPSGYANAYQLRKMLKWGRQQIQHHQLTKAEPAKANLADMFGAMVGNPTWDYLTKVMTDTQSGSDTLAQWWQAKSNDLRYKAQPLLKWIHAAHALACHPSPLLCKTVRSGNFLPLDSIRTGQGVGVLFMEILHRLHHQDPTADLPAWAPASFLKFIQCEKDESLFVNAWQKVVIPDQWKQDLWAKAATQPAWQSTFATHGLIDLSLLSLPKGIDLTERKKLVATVLDHLDKEHWNKTYTVYTQWLTGILPEYTAACDLLTGADPDTIYSMLKNIYAEREVIYTPLPELTVE